MVLRDFFTQLGDIYDFHFEKNRNGSYRVNTVIKELIYDDYIHQQTLMNHR